MLIISLFALLCPLSFSGHVHNCSPSHPFTPSFWTVVTYPSPFGPPSPFYMNVRATRDGVAEVFERDRVALIMEKGITQRYVHRRLSPSSGLVRDGHFEEAESGSTTTSGLATKSSSSPLRLTCPLHYTVRRCSRTEYYLHFSPLPHGACADSMESIAAGVSSPMSVRWKSPDDEVCVAATVAAECWRHAAFTELTQRDLRRLCGLPEETVAGANVRRDGRTPSSRLLSATPSASRPRRSSPPLVTHQEFFEMPPRWVMQSLGEVDRHPFHSFAEWDCRYRVTPLDMGATVVKKATGAESTALLKTGSAPDGGQAASQASPAAPLYLPARMATERGGASPRQASSRSLTPVLPPQVNHLLHHHKSFRVRATAAMACGAHWVDIVPLAAEEECQRGEEKATATSADAISALTETVTNGSTCERVDRDTLLLHPPAALYVDPLLPCDELYSERGVNTGVYAFFLRALQQRRQREREGCRISRSTAARDRDNESKGVGAGEETGVPDPAEAAAALAVQLSVCARQRRRELTRRIDRAVIAANRSSALRRAASREAATPITADTAVSSSEFSGLEAPAVSLQVRVDYTRGSVQLRALIQESTAYSTREMPASEQDAREPAVAYTSLPLRQTCPCDRESFPAASVKRGREDAGDGDAAMPHSRRVSTTAATQSPTVEVLLRSARKLAALYDMTRSASLAPREGDGDASEESGRARMQRRAEAQTCASSVPSSSRLATSLLERLADTPHEASNLEAPGASGAHSEAPCESTWGTLVLYQRDALLPSTALSAGPEAIRPALPLPQIDRPIASSIPLPLPDDNSPARAPAGIAIADTTLAANTIIATAAERVFLARLFTLLLRYRTLFGEHGYNQGPQAAVPPPVMEQLAASFEISAEAFASPLNAQLPQFGSLFPDTDRHFGSLGSFFDLQFGDASGELGTQRAPTSSNCAAAPPPGCHVEVNPPFDTTLLRHVGEHLLCCLTRAQESAQSLLFLVVLPSHDLTDEEKAVAAARESTQLPTARRPTQTAAAKRLGNDYQNRSGAAAASVPPSTDRALRESTFCLGHVLCAAAESAYVDGHQHLLHSPFFRIETPTRLILLGNAAARARFPHATAQLESVRTAWKELTESALRPQH
ncbi:hypothetical protein CUR178_06063 [Leishmania enriettii]|uniref:PCIF1 WW domain-containing protein n=1 Tax=Leishmania enriettii TaxID=5663 RepID=A0A836GXZ0_LEIEN|nr:hypothetical protein CUR178_06063 [Leishmania enriettii]